MRKLNILETEKVVDEIRKVISGLVNGVKKLELEQPYSENSDVFITGYWVGEYFRIDVQFKDKK